MKNLKNIILIAALIILAIPLIFASIDIRLYIAYAIFGVGILAFLVSVLSSLAWNIKSKLKSIIAGVLLVVVFMIFYFITPVNDVTPKLYESTGTGMGWSPIIGAGLYTVYALLAVMVVFVLFSQVKKLLD